MWLFVNIYSGKTWFGRRVYDNIFYGINSSNGHTACPTAYVASVFAKQGHPSIRGCPSNLLFGLITKRYAGYSHESIETKMSCNIPSGLITDMSASSSKVDVGSKADMPSFS